jgi:ankyrin repeat protein
MDKPVDDNQGPSDPWNYPTNEESKKGTVDPSLPTDVDTLQLLVGDLNRRLQNALHVIDSQKLSTANSVRLAAMSKADLHKVSLELNLERNKSETQSRRKIKDEEYARYDREKKRAEKMHEDLRLAMIDHSMSNVKKEPVKLIKMRKNLDKLEKTQASQKQLLHHISIQEQLIEDLSNLAQQADLDGCKNVIRRGVNVNEVDSAGFLPLHYACSSGSLAVVQLLLEFGSDATSYLTGTSPMVLAAEAGHREVILKLASFSASIEDTGSGMTPPIVAAAKNCHLRAIETLITLGANINAADIDGNTALHMAAKFQNPVPVIRCLLMNGANTKIPNSKGLTALQVSLILHILNITHAQ